MITLKDLAKQLGVSKSTVSRALKNHPRIGLKTRERVQELATALEYEPNVIAIQLKNKRSNLIGVIVPDISRYFYATIIAGIQHEAEKFGMQLLIVQSSDNETKEQELIHSLLRTHVDGLIVAVSKHTSDISIFKKLQKRRFPFVFVARVVEGFPGVMSNDRMAAYQVTSYLIQKQYQSIAYISGPNTLYISKDRERGFLDAQIENKRAPSTYFIGRTNLDKPSNIEALFQIWNSGFEPEAVFCFNDSVAFDIRQVLVSKGLLHTEVVGFGNEPASFYANPPISTVDQLAFDLGIQAYNLLKACINQPNFNPGILLREARFINRNIVE